MNLAHKPVYIGIVWWFSALVFLTSATAVDAKGRIHGVTNTKPQERTVNQDYIYTTNNGTITITRYTGLGGAIIIPGHINALPVTSIGESAFYACNRLVHISISTNVTSIGNNAFRSCSSLTNIMLPSSLTSIGDLAFSCCSSLTGVTIPNSVKTIGDSAFAYCTSLTNIMISQNITLIRFGTFQYCTHLPNITIPSSVTSIQFDAFLNCKSLNGIYFKGNAPGLGAHVFDNTPATVYYRPGTSGWGTTFGDRPTAVWK